MHDAPIFRGGVVSQKFPGSTRLKMDGGVRDLKDIFLIDAWAFPGNSGSPVFLRPSALRYTVDRPNVNLTRPYIAGVQGAAMGGTGLTIVYGADGIEAVAAQFPDAKCPAPLSSKPNN